MARNYKNRAFCTGSATCRNAENCPNAITPEQLQEAQAMGAKVKYKATCGAYAPKPEPGGANKAFERVKPWEASEK